MVSHYKRGYTVHVNTWAVLSFMTLSRTCSWPVSVRGIVIHLSGCPDVRPDVFFCTISWKPLSPFT